MREHDICVLGVEKEAIFNTDVQQRGDFSLRASRERLLKSCFPTR